jgi:predicted GNAT family acetyltransferase
MITEIGSPASFMEKTSTYRSRFPYETQQMTSYVADLVNQDIQGWQFWIYTINETVEAMFLKAPNNSMFISPLNSEAATEIVTHLANEGLDVKRIVGELESSNLLANLIKDKFPHIIEVEEEMKTNAYVLSSLNLYSSPTGAWRSASGEDRDLLISWNSNYIREALGYEPEKVENLVDRVLKDQRTYFWVENGEPVCMMGYSQPTPAPNGNIVRIFPVYTPLELRGRGFAKCLVSQICLKLKKDELGIMLYADSKNPQANEIYKKIGFVEIGTYGNLLFKTV